jgi:radical SAM protein (TIGR01212 family)
MLTAAKTDNVVGIAIATRSDCINTTYLDVLKQIETQFKCDIYLEYGLQSVNNQTLQKINRGHDVKSFDDAVRLTQSYGFNTCAHMILNLPWDSMEDVIEGAKHLSAIGVNQVKCHALYIAENTIMGEMYQKNEITICSLEEYIQRVVAFMQALDPEMVVQRLIGRAPKEDMLFVNWNTSWWKIHDMITSKL